MATERALIVFAHPDPNSFTAALKNAAVTELEGAGVAVEVSDLYAMGFEAVAGPADVSERMNTDGFNLALEQAHALEKGALAEDIVREQDKVRAADLIIFQFPMWWYGMPAIMKGWVDRVLSYKFAYGVGQWWDQGLLRDKRAMLAITTGTPAGAYAPDGRNGDIDRVLWPIEAGMLAICGLKVVPSFLAYGAPWIGDEGRAGQIAAYRKAVAGAGTAAPKFFHPLSDYGDNLRLLPDVEPATAGQHRPA
jgi:NAD(P)H dehydrogenase (quinone)